MRTNTFSRVESEQPPKMPTDGATHAGMPLPVYGLLFQPSTSQPRAKLISPTIDHRFHQNKSGGKRHPHLQPLLKDVTPSS